MQTCLYFVMYGFDVLLEIVSKYFHILKKVRNIKLKKTILFKKIMKTKHIST